MDRLELLLRDTLDEHAADAPTGPVQLPEADHRVRNAVALVAVAAAVIAVAVAVALTRAAAPKPTLLPNGTLGLGAGMRWASYGSVSLQVPADLPTRTSLCGGQIADEVVSSAGALSLCPEVATQLTPHPGTVVWFSPADGGSPYTGLPTTPTTVDGQPARIGIVTGRSRLGDGVSGVVVLPTQDVRVGVTASTRAGVEAILASVRVSSVDPSGCAARLRAAATQPPGPADRMFPAEPTSAVRCEYNQPGDRLIGSWRLGTAATTRLAAALNRLRPDPCGCIHPGFGVVAGSYDVLYFRFPHHRPLRVSGTSGPGPGVYSNGRWSVVTYGASNYRVMIGRLLFRLTNQR